MDSDLRMVGGWWGRRLRPARAHACTQNGCCSKKRDQHHPRYPVVHRGLRIGKSGSRLYSINFVKMFSGGIIGEIVRLPHGAARFLRNPLWIAQIRVDMADSVSLESR